jgi:hypothetical protein
MPSLGLSSDGGRILASDELKAKIQKKESKILQNEATKCLKINKTLPKIDQNEAKRSEKPPSRAAALPRL